MATTDSDDEGDNRCTSCGVKMAGNGVCGDCAAAAADNPSNGDDS
jgi:hypothetical protein